jgi:3-deoxy-D-manno-octulosonate 8-phosphate phosphatase (KDO 8-P phosphatase)
MIGSEELRERLRAVRMLVMDVDGVLTDGRLWLMEGGREMKQFHVHDGTAIKYLHRAGLLTALITGRRSSAVSDRADELGIPIVYQDIKVKVEALDEILSREKLEAREVCYIGDDLPDIPTMRRVGLAVAVSNARPEVRAIAHYVTEAPGGNGAVREVVELVLKAQDRWDGLIMARYQ